MTLKDTPSAISSPASAVGRLRSQWPDGHQLDLFGQDHAHASHTAPPENKKVMQTSETFGQNFSASSASAALSQSLASRLKTRLDTGGSMEYRQTWKARVTPAGRQYWEHTASARRTSGSVCSGWRSQSASDGEGGTMDILKAMREGLTPMLKLRDQAPLADWHTPQAHDSSPRGKGQKLKHGTKHGCGDLNADAQIAGWPTPHAQEIDGRGEYSDPRKVLKRFQAGHQRTLSNVAVISGWRTPTATDGTNGGPNARDSSGGMHLSGQAEIAGWSTPTVNDAKNNAAPSQFKRSTKALNVQASGITQSSSRAPTEKRGALNPDLSRWLMGYPEEHLSCGVMAMRSCLKSRQNS